jgi:hypothetical protein
MKKCSFLLIAISFVTLLTINACKSSSKPAEPATNAVPEKVDSLKQAVDTNAVEDVDTSDVVED